MAAILYRVHVEDWCPKLTWESPEMFPQDDLWVFDGRSKFDALQRKGLRIREEVKDKLGVVHSLAPGCIVIPGETATTSDEVYYSLVYTVEVVMVPAQDDWVNILNPNLENLARKHPHDLGVPCMLTFGGPHELFRIEGRDPFELYCCTGVPKPAPNIMELCESVGWKGLRFEEVWRGVPKDIQTTDVPPGWTFK